MATRAHDPLLERRLLVGGLVQGAGFRPFVFRLAQDLQLSGFVRNTAAGVEIEVRAARSRLDQFQRRLCESPPPLARVCGVRAVAERMAARGAALPLGDGFRIVDSEAGAGAGAMLPPDAAICADCRRDIANPEDRRYRYPFTTCSHCGPRYSITLAMPYDRANTTMAEFAMCEECRREYDDPSDRRFHAQPIACPHCGPRLMLVDPAGIELERGEAALAAAVRRVADGGIVAFKGIGGFQLLVDAANEPAIQRLRERKRRPEKPFAILVADR